MGFIFQVLASLSLIEALLVEFAFLFLIIGVINTYLTERVWRVELQTGLVTDLLHGFALSLVLKIVSIPVSIVMGVLFLDADIFSIAIRFTYQFAILAFVYSYLAKGAAESFEERSSLQKK